MEECASQYLQTGCCLLARATCGNHPGLVSSESEQCAHSAAEVLTFSGCSLNHNILVSVLGTVEQSNKLLTNKCKKAHLFPVKYIAINVMSVL